MSVATAYEDYGSILNSALTGALAGQDGSTSDKANSLFENGKVHAIKVAEDNSGKSKSYKDAADALEGLRSDLTTIAALGNQEIDGVNANTQLLDKVTPITKIVGMSNFQAGRASDIWGAKIAAAAQDVLTASGDLRSISQFAKDNGITLEASAALPSTELLTQRVKENLDHLNNAAGTDPPLSAITSASTIVSNSAVSPGEQPTLVSKITETSTSGQISSVKFGSSEFTGSSTPAAVGTRPPTADLPRAQSIELSGASAPTAPGSITSAGGASGALSGAGNLSGAAGGGSPSLPSAGSLGGGSQPLSPDSLAQSFTSGMQAGAPASAGAEALSQSISDTVQSQAPQHNTPPPISPPTTASGGFAFEAPQHYSEPPAPAPATEAQHQPMYAAPVAPAPAAAAPMMAPPPAAAAGPLPTYGSDLRPATAAAPPPPVAGAAPMSAPVNPASGTAAGTQPAVVRQQSTSAATAPPTGLVENALTAAATGATAGVASEQAIANARLQRLLEAVARQEPKLAWAIGDREDGTTILVTDLASGWIPPHVEIPTGVQILTPIKRRGNVEHLLGESTNFAIWTPGHYLPPAKDVDPVQMSFRARKVPDIDELNWEITQATNWRDGLPRLAHTLTKAGIAGTGVLETEADLLYEHLTLTRDRVVKSYPNDVDATDIGNWQLLAAIGGLIAKDSTTLKYHFAWFQALSMATQGGTR